MAAGCPKMKPDNTYTLTRDRVFGSEKWSRMTSMVCIVAHTDDVNRRLLIVEPRQGPPERFDLIWEDGRLVEAPPTEPAPLSGDVNVSDAEREVLDWAASEDWFRAGTVRKQVFGDKLSGKTMSTVLAGLVTRRLLEQQGTGRQVKYRRPRVVVPFPRPK
jgi:hypothetical protein